MKLSYAVALPDCQACGNFGDVAAQDLARFVRETVASQINMFIRAYREQNPTP